jgi:aspartate/tyrosine/aromatic aminotransferase
MFNQLEMAPPDAILGLTEAFKADENPNKVNLGVGVYKDANGATPILNSVKTAEQRLYADEKTKGYLPIPGDSEYGATVRPFLFGAGHEIICDKRAVTAHTPGGTGGLRVAGDFIHRIYPNAKIWLSNPTWANHGAIFESAGVERASYPYYDAENKCVSFDAMVEALKTVPEGDVVLLHGCCHNPSGMDLSLAQWEVVAGLAAEQKFIPLVDFAYQGLGDGIEEDAAGLRAMCRPGSELIVVSSFSKNFGLYRERTGALTLVASDADGAQKAFSHLKKCIRTNYSNPPAHGAAIVTTILNDCELRGQWEEELKEMRDRINGMRKLLVETLKAKGVERDFSFITTQKGMFSFSGLNKDQVATLREKCSIYIVGSGRINVAGMTEANMDAICEAIKDVL